MNVYTTLIHNCPKLEANSKSSTDKWVNKQKHIHTMEYNSVIKRNQQSSHEKTRKNLKCTLLSA